MQLARVESRAAAARGLGAGDRDAGEGRRPPRTAGKLLLRYSLAGLVAVVPPEQYLGSLSQHPCQSPVLPPTPTSGPETQQRDRVDLDLPGVLYHWAQKYLHGSSSRLHGVINPRALELIPIPTLIARELKSK